MIILLLVTAIESSRLSHATEDKREEQPGIDRQGGPETGGVFGLVPRRTYLGVVANATRRTKDWRRSHTDVFAFDRQRTPIVPPGSRASLPLPSFASLLLRRSLCSSG